MIAILGVAWWMRRASVKPAEQVVSIPAPARESRRSKPPKPVPIGPGQIATASDLELPWSAQRFMFQNQVTSQMFPAVAVRLPGGGLWGISLREPDGRCELQYLTNLDALGSQYHFRATHPMVVDPCSGAVYDLSQYANGPNGLVRGQVVRGTANRPPVAIEVEQHGNSIVAVRMENTTP